MDISTNKGIFVRQATGLVKGLRWYDGIIMALAYFNVAVGAFLVFGWGSWLFPGANMVITIGLVGLIVDIPVVLVYSWFSMLMPRTGGDYIYVSRSLSSWMGFAVGLVFFIFLSAFSVGQNAWFSTTTVISPYLAAIGSTNNLPGLVSFASEITKPGPSVLIGVILLLIVFFVLTRSSETVHKIMFGLFVIAFLGWPIIYIIALASSSNAAFVNAFNSYALRNNFPSYSQVIATAKSSGFSIIPSNFNASVLALPIVYATVAFPQGITYLGGEVKKANRSLPLSLITSLFVLVGVVALMGYFTYNVFGYNFLDASSSLGFTGTNYPFVSPPYTDYFLAILYPNIPFNIFMMISALCWELLLMIMFGLMATRFLFASSFDRVLPSWVSDISDRFHSPVKASIILMFIAFIFLASTAFNFIVTYFDSVTAWTTAYILVMVAGIVLPFRRKDLLKYAPPIVKKTVGGIPLISIFGILGVISLGVVFYTLLLNPDVSGATVLGLTVVTLAYVIGIVWYFASVSYKKRRSGLDPSLAFREIPPE
jgi:APA family basic amino acid/polyamine antiporter